VHIDPSQLGLSFSDWLVGALATSGMQAGLRLVRGTPAERELRKVLASALDSALQQVPELSRDPLRAALRERFSEPPRLAIGPGGSAREALKASIDAQLAALADPSATTADGRSYLDIIGVDADWLSGALAAATIDAIRAAAASAGVGGLAAQLNAESADAKLDAVLDVLLKLTHASAGSRGVPAAYSLPPPALAFTGRERALSELRASWQANRAAGTACSIAGPAGIGKSALAIQFAHEVKPDFPHGQLYVDLRGGADHDDAGLGPADVLRQFLWALGVPSSDIPPSDAERSALYRSLLHGRRVLIVLDNARGEAQVRPLLPGSPGCLALITSRRPLAALDTARPPLQLPLLDEQDAAQMLTRLAGPERVRAEPEQTAEVVRLCGRLPLALRITGGRLRTRPQWPVSEIARRLADERRRLAELKVGDLDIRASLMLSYRELDEAQALLLRRLGLLPGTTFDLLLATAVGGQFVVGGSAHVVTMRSAEEAIRQSAVVLAGAAAIQQEERAALGKVEAGLDALVDAQLVEAGAPGYYRLHDLVQVFARDLFREDDSLGAEQMMAELNYIGWAQAQAEAAIAWKNLAPDDLPARYRQSFASRPDVDGWLEQSHLNLVTAVETAYQWHHDQTAAQLAGDLWYLFMRNGLPTEMEPVLKNGSAAAQRVGDVRGQADLLYMLGALRLSRRSFADAAAAFQDGLALSAPGESSEQRAEALTLLANALTCVGRLEEAAARLADADRLMEAGDAPSRSGARIAGERATLLELSGDDAGALSGFSQALGLSRATGDVRQQAGFLERIGSVHLRQRRKADAIRCLEESLALCQDDRGLLRVKSEAMLSLGRADMMDGVTRRAKDLLAEAAANFGTLQIPEKEAEARYYQTLAYRRLRDWAKAAESWAQARAAVGRAEPETTRGLRELIDRARPQPPIARRPRTQTHLKANPGNPRQKLKGQDDDGK
jgi:tetratricopeptide (TPR) repeat protein